MKLLENEQFARIGDALSTMGLESQICFRIESYSCKMAGQDKKLFKQMSSEGQPFEPLNPSSPHSYEPLSTSQSSHTDSIMCHSVSRRTLYYLKATLNASFAPDYDFSDTKSHEFCRESRFDLAQRAIDANLSAAEGDQYAAIAPSLWFALETEISPNECAIYSYNPDMQSDPFMEEGALWSFNYFFYNKKMKRVVFLCCYAVRPVGDVIPKSALGPVPDDLIFEVDDDIVMQTSEDTPTIMIGTY